MGIVRHRESPHLLTILKKPSSAASAGSLSRPVWPVPATVSPCSKLFAAEKKSAATTLVPAAQARNTKSAAAQTPDRSGHVPPSVSLCGSSLRLRALCGSSFKVAKRKNSHEPLLRAQTSKSCDPPRQRKPGHSQPKAIHQRNFRSDRSITTTRCWLSVQTHCNRQIRYTPLHSPLRETTFRQKPYHNAKFRCPSEHSTPTRFQTAECQMCWTRCTQCP